jgi:hypothetical protein
MAKGQPKTSKKGPAKPKAVTIKSKAAAVDPKLDKKATPPPPIGYLFDGIDLTDEPDNMSLDFDWTDAMDLREYQLASSTPDK